MQYNRTYILRNSSIKIYGHNTIENLSDMGQGWGLEWVLVY